MHWAPAMGWALGQLPFGTAQNTQLTWQAACERCPATALPASVSLLRFLQFQKVIPLLCVCVCVCVCVSCSSVVFHYELFSTHRKLQDANHKSTTRCMCCPSTQILDYLFKCFYIYINVIPQDICSAASLFCPTFSLEDFMHVDTPSHNPFILTAVEHCSLPINHCLFILSNSDKYFVF